MYPQRISILPNARKVNVATAKCEFFLQLYVRMLCFVMLICVSAIEKV